MFSALKKWAKGGNEDSKLSTPMGVRAMGQALQRKFARGVQYNMKIVIKGDRNTGKSCLFQRLQGKPFSEQYIPTNEIQVASIQWNYRTTDDVVKVEVWDVVDKGRSRKSQGSLKLENDKKDEHSTDGSFLMAIDDEPFEGEKDGTVLDAEFVDVYKGAHGVLMTMDITKPWTFKYLERELPKVPPHIPVLVLANHRDMGEHRLVPTEEAIAFIEHLERPDRSPPVHYAETSMRNGFGLKYIHKFLNLPFLLLQRETLLKQLQVNAEDTESTLEELQIHKESEEQDYDKFVSMLHRRKKDHEAKKAAAAAAAAAEGDAEQTTSPGTPSDADRTGKSPSGNTSTDKERPSRRTPSATGQAVTQDSLPQNGLSHSSTNIDEFVPEDELDAGFLDEEGGSRGKKRTNKPAAKKPPKPVEVEQDDSEDSESDSEGRNPMVAGFAEDIDSEDENATSVITNHVNEGLNVVDPFTTPTKPTTALTVEVTLSEEEEEEDEDEQEKIEEEKRNERVKREKAEEQRTKDKQKRESGSLKLSLEMPAKPLVTERPVVDGLGLGTDDVDDWLNSPDSDPKIPFRASPADREYTARKSDTPAIPVDEWEMFMASQMKPQTKGATTTSSSLIDMGLDGDNNTETNEESKSRKKKEHKSGEKSKSKHKRKHKDKGEEGEDSEKKDKDKERRKSRHREGEEGKDRRRSRDEEGERKKKHRSKQSKAKSEEGVQDGVTYEEL